MTKDELIKATQINWFDTNLFVKAHKSWQSSGNGILYTGMLSIFSGYPAVACTCKRGCLTRNPQGSFGQESWDDYMGLIGASIATNTGNFLKEFLWYGIKHFGFYNNTGKFTWSAWLWRFPQVWVLCWCAAFPWLKWPLWPALWLIAKLQALNAANASAVILSWIYLESCKNLGFTFSNYAKARSMLNAAIVNQFEAGHPFIEFTKDWGAE